MPPSFWFPPGPAACLPQISGCKGRIHGYCTKDAGDATVVRATGIICCSRQSSCRRILSSEMWTVIS